MSLRNKSALSLKTSWRPNLRLDGHTQISQVFFFLFFEKGVFLFFNRTLLHIKTPTAQLTLRKRSLACIISLLLQSKPFIQSGQQTACSPPPSSSYLIQRVCKPRRYYYALVSGGSRLHRWRAQVCLGYSANCFWCIWRHHSNKHARCILLVSLHLALLLIFLQLEVVEKNMEEKRKMKCIKKKTTNE